MPFAVNSKYVCLHRLIHRYKSLYNIHIAHWKLLLGQDVSTGGYFHSDLIETAVSDPGQPYSNIFSIIGLTRPNEFFINNQYKFRLRYNDGNALSNNGQFDQIWTQTNWLLDDLITGSSLGDDSSVDCPGFVGLAKSTGHNGETEYSLLDGNDHNHCWYHVVGMTADGAMSAHSSNGLIPVDYDNNAHKVQLFVCTTGDDCDYSMCFCILLTSADNA